MNDTDLHMLAALIKRLTDALYDDHRHSVTCPHGPECPVCRLIAEAREVEK